MKLERLEIAGFMHFTEPAVIDLRDIPEGSIVAIIGENGAGKTRLNDGCIAVVPNDSQPIFTFPSRDGRMADYATSRDAYIDTLYSFDGKGSYRSRLNVDGHTRNADAVLEQIGHDGAGVPLNDGKVSTYAEAARGLFPSKDVLLASAYAAQNRAGSFVTAKPGARKDLFQALIGLAHYERMAATARACLDIVTRARLTLVERRDMVARDITAAIDDALQARANALQAEGVSAQLRRGELQNEIEALNAEREELTESATAHLAAVARVETLRDSVAVKATELSQVDTDEASANTDAASDRFRAEARWETSAKDIDHRRQQERDSCAAVLKDCDERIEGNKRLTDEAEQIRAAVVGLDDARTQLADLRTKESSCRDVLDSARDQVAQRERMLKPVEDAEKDLRDAKGRVAMFETVPCHGAGEYAACGFLTDAAAALARIPELETQAAQRTTLESGITLWTDKVDAAQTSLRATLIAIAQVEARIKTLEPTAQYAAQLAETQARIDGYIERKQQASADLMTRLADLNVQSVSAEEARHAAVVDIDARLTARLQALTDRRAELTAQHDATVQQLTAAQAQADATAEAATRLATVDRELEASRQAWTENESLLAAHGVKRDELDRDRATFGRRKAEHEDICGRLRQVEDRLLIWQTYTKACGRDGLPTLEIAAAGPTVSNLTNELLSVGFGSRFTLELVTQTARADGKGLKEDFTIRVFDNEFGGEARDIADLSGGERVVVEEAFRAALGLYVNSRNVAPIRTCWRDETTGALDPENAVRYVAMLRRMQQLGGYAHVLFITHNEDCAALADVRIVVKNGQPEVRRAA